ncbi:MAG TPA: hypothetical protein VHA82_02350 [Ramlibacter sp.]|uniref:hypothetical protein n=1 Tax=Ramlibacter sp. TaxID=1917967 RepID=UPI002CB2B24F|nr:hypothetical protein [Ramlibacter sp.]HVZ42623.1 hypothetical protein [Ramlibacter sp.]
MDLRLQLLESFTAQGSDGTAYKVFAYDRLAPDPSLADGSEHWASTGQVEYRLADGRRIDVGRDGSLSIASTGVRLKTAAHS